MNSKDDDMMIRAYKEEDANALKDMLIEEGSGWETYSGSLGWPRYMKALRESVSYLAFDKDRLVGYVRARDDDGFGVYVYDLLVRQSDRGQAIGQALLKHVKTIHKDQTVYVMSDVDPYYDKLGYQKAGSVFKVD